MANKDIQDFELEKEDDFQDMMESDFADWVSELEEAEQPKACSIDDPECEACGS
jgi:hypothetical protein